MGRRGDHLSGSGLTAFDKVLLEACAENEEVVVEAGMHSQRVDGLLSNLSDRDGSEQQGLREIRKVMSARTNDQSTAGHLKDIKS